MKTVFDSKYQKVDSYEEKQLLHFIFKPETEEMTNQIYKDEYLKIIELFNNHTTRISKTLVDMRHFLFSMEPELQLWHNQNVFAAAIKMGMKKMAILVSTDIFTEVSVQQTVEEEKTQSFETKYFDSEEAAKKWLEI